MTYNSEIKEILDFVEFSLPNSLTREQKEFKILSEGDLQSCVYYHLRRFFKKKKYSRWYIINKLPMGDRSAAKLFPDIAITWMSIKKPRKSYPDILIELKESMNFKEETARKEIKKLQKMLKYYRLYYGFFLYACLDKRGNRKVKDTDKIMKEMIPKKWKGWLIPKTINIKGKKTYSADMDYFDEKIKILRKYRG